MTSQSTTLFADKVMDEIERRADKNVYSSSKCKKACEVLIRKRDNLELPESFYKTVEKMSKNYTTRAAATRIVTIVARKFKLSEGDE